MIRYRTTPGALRAKIRAARKSWFEDARAVLAALPDPPKSADFKPLWGEIKRLYIELQHSKCCFCETPLEGAITQDVEHFRPKAEVKPWQPSPRLRAAGVVVAQPADGRSEPGYARLAYHPLNYAMACKNCNSVLKKNFFPIAGARHSAGTDPTRMKQERALLIYPLGALDADPEDLIEYEGLSPRPRKPAGFARRRTLVTIELFRLDDPSGRRALYKGRALLLWLLFRELDGRAKATGAAARQKHADVIANLTADHNPFTRCLRSFARLYKANPARATALADECLKYLKSKAVCDVDRSHTRTR